MAGKRRTPVRSKSTTKTQRRVQPLDTNPLKTSPKSSKPPRHVAAKGGGSYTVKRGDTLWGIAKKRGTTVSAILKKNPKLRANPRLIYAGTKVKF